ncbi:hypothetical protein AB751O23_CH_00010, partial [Chlamydiales bacterium SCGC AB-751-O23]
LIEDPTLNRLKKNWQRSDLAHLKNKYQYILLGSIKHFGNRKLKSNQKLLAYSKVHIQIIDVELRKVIYEEYGDSQVSETDSSPEQYDINNRALQRSIMALAPKISERLLSKKWKAPIIEGYKNNEQDYLVIAAEKEQNLSKGQTLEVVLSNKDLRNPLTNTRLTMLGKSIALIEIESFDDQKPGDGKAICRVLGEQLDPYIKSQNFESLFVRMPDLPK